MTQLIEHIANKDYESANKTLEENFRAILESKLHEMKKMCAATMEQNTHAERQKRLRMDVLEQDDAPATGNFRPLNAPKADDAEINKSLQNLKRSTEDPGGFQQQQRLRSGTSQLAEDEIEEGLLKVARDKLKLKTPAARANASERPVMRNIAGKPLVGKKLKIAPKNLEEDIEQLDEAPRVGVVKLRIRGGKVERRKKVSNVPGMTIRGGKLTRMSPAERRRRKLGAKKAARKTKAKKAQIMRKRKISLQKRARLGG